MATNPRKRQQKLERRAAKRKEKKHVIVREQQAGLPQRLETATKYPVLDAWITDEVWTQGIGQVLINRELPNGFVALASFLVDRFCLGVKDAFAKIISGYSYQNDYKRKMHLQLSPQDVAPAKARKFVEDAVAYAHSLGFAPHPDYQEAKILFGDINAAECTETFEFGKDGQPYFIAGPHDSPARCKMILATLTRTCGPGAFHYLVGFKPGELSLDDSELEPTGLIDQRIDPDDVP